MTPNKSPNLRADFRVATLGRSNKLYGKSLEFRPWIRQLHMAFFALKPRMSVVDLGCGPGFFSRYLARMAGGKCKIVGVDIREPSLRAAISGSRKEGLSEPISYCLGDVYDLPFEDEYADLTCCRSLLMNLTDPTAALKEMTRITKPRGRVVAVEKGKMYSFYDPEDERYTDLQRDAYHAWLKGLQKLDGKQLRIGEALPSMFQKAGLSDIMLEIQPYTLLPCDPRRSTRSVRAEIELGHSRAVEQHGNDRQILRTGGMPEGKIDEFFERYQSWEKRFLFDRRLRNNTTLFADTFFLVAGLKT